jgi:hypothetical protein
LGVAVDGDRQAVLDEASAELRALAEELLRVARDLEERVVRLEEEERSRDW